MKVLERHAGSSLDNGAPPEARSSGPLHPRSVRRLMHLVADAVEIEPAEPSARSGGGTYSPPSGNGRPDRRGVEAGLQDRALIVEGDTSLASVVNESLSKLGLECRVASTIGDAWSLLSPRRNGWFPNLVVLDVTLPDGTALDLMRHMTDVAPRPYVVAMSGGNDAVQAFELARNGVQALLTKPFASTQLEAAVEEAMTVVPDLRPQMRALVGRRPIQELEDELRHVMADEAMARAGSVRGAARLLSVSRQFMQYTLRISQ
jgi:two-component system response regulator RegA